MNRPTRLPRLAAFATMLLLATTALAATVASLEADAQQLIDDIALVQAQADACPGGDCLEASQIRADADDLDARRLDLHAQRDQLDPNCDCATLDALIADVDADVDALQRQIREWDEL